MAAQRVVHEDDFFMLHPVPHLFAEFKTPDGESYNELSPAAMQQQIDTMLEKLHAANVEHVTMVSAAAGPVARRIASQCPPNTVFHVMAPGCKLPVCVAYPPVEKKPEPSSSADGAALPTATNKVEMIYQAPDLAAMDPEKAPKLVVIWLTMNPRINVQNVPRELNELAGDNPQLRVRAMFRFLISASDSGFMNDRNASALVNAAFIAGDEALSALIAAEGGVLGIISGLPTPLTLAVGKRLRPGLLGRAEMVDFKLNDGGYVVLHQSGC